MNREEKSEIRNPNFETISNIPNPQFKTDPSTGASVSVVRAWNFEFVSDFVLRVSNFRVARSWVLEEAA
jgi:hypothetical protein